MLLLRWADVDWERGRLLIRSPKTEHHEGKDSRLVPIFPEPVRSLTTISKKRRRIRRSQERKSANRTESRSSARCVKTKKPRSFRGFLPLTAHSISAPSRTRTYNLMIKSHLLYQLSYRGEAG